MKKRMIISSLASVIILSIASFASASDELKFPQSASEIIELLEGEEGVVREINGIKYVYTNDTLYKFMGGKRWKVRGLAGVEAAELMPRVGAMVLFELGSAKISKRSRELLAEIGKALSAPQFKGARFMIEGHTDSKGEGEYNQELAKMRAESVKNYLATRCHVRSDQLMTAGFGESKPIASNDTEAGRQRNRRVEIVRLLTE